MADEFFLVNTSLKEILIDSGLGVGVGLFFVLLNVFDPQFVIGIPLIQGLSVVGTTVVVVLIAPIAEEILFRSFALSIADILTNIYVAVPVQAIAFSAFHFQAYGVGLITAFIAAGMFGVIAGLMTWQRKSIIPSIWMHAIFNAFILSQKLVIVAF